MNNIKFITPQFSPTNNTNKSVKKIDMFPLAPRKINNRDITTTSPPNNNIESYPHKRDYIIIYPYDSITVKYEAYAVLFDGITALIIVLFKKNDDVPFIIYSESQQDPFVIIENIYKYEMGRGRSLYLKSFRKTIYNPNNTESPPNNNSINDNITDVDIDQEIIDLSIIIANDLYITTSPRDKIDRAFYIFMQFYY